PFRREDRICIERHKEGTPEERFDRHTIPPVHRVRRDHPADRAHPRDRPGCEDLFQLPAPPSLRGLRRLPCPRQASSPPEISPPGSDSSALESRMARLVLY